MSNLDPNGTVRKYSDSGTMVWSVSRTYQVGTIKYLPTKLAAVGPDTVMASFGDRYMARMKASDGQILWTKDIGLRSGLITYSATDIAAIASP